MMLTYKCECGEERIFTRPQEKVTCKKCGTEMNRVQGEVNTSIMTFEEDRFMADEALFNSIGNRVGKKSAQGVQD